MVMPGSRVRVAPGSLAAVSQRIGSCEEFVVVRCDGEESFDGDGCPLCELHSARNEQKCVLAREDELVRG